MQITTRLGYAAKEFFATAKKLRARWTGDEKRGYKIDRGVEWFNEAKAEFKKGIQWTNKIKLFQAIFSSINWQKDPKKKLASPGCLLGTKVHRNNKRIFPFQRHNEIHLRSGYSKGKSIPGECLVRNKL